MLLNISGALSLVVITIVIAALLLRRSRWGGALSSGKGLLEIKHSFVLGQRERVVIVGVADRCLLLSVTPSGITLLTEMDKYHAADEEDVPTSNFQQMLLRSITKKPGNRG
ncbi:flagellar biosynthetic protein FliO [Pantoea sp. Eser]|nr:flagellar biosynthetic protein FliO [Pantoea sp. Eser]